MGYCIQQTACKFFVEAQYAEFVAYKLHQHYFEPQFDYQGNIASVWFRAEKLYDQLCMLQGIAPFVRDGSYIEMQGEDFKRWRWEFRDGKCRKACAVFVRPVIRKKALQNA